MPVAVTRAVSARIADCRLTHLSRIPIDVERARSEHAKYEECLTRLGCRLVRLPQEPDLPDSVFVEDAAVVLDEAAVITRPGASSRREETRSVAEALTPYRELRFIEPPGTLDGGDVLRMGKRLYVGRSSRSNEAGIEQLRKVAGAFEYEVIAVPVTGCLHLKSGVTALDPERLLLNPEWIDPSAFPDHEIVPVHPAEPAAANALAVGGNIVFPMAFSRTRQLLVDRGFTLSLVEAGELAKAEGGVTCCSIIFEAPVTADPGLV